MPARRLLRGVFAPAFGALLIASSCGSNEGAGAGAPTFIDVEKGTYRGVGVGDDRAEMEREFGPNEPADLEESGNPLGDEDDFGPVGFNPFPGDAPPRWFRYEDVAFFFAWDEISVVTVTVGGAVTERDVAIGDPLEEAREAYRVRCGMAHENSEFGPPYPACAGKIAPRRFVWFGGDPIRNITFGTVDLWGV